MRLNWFRPKRFLANLSIGTLLGASLILSGCTANGQGGNAPFEATEVIAFNETLGTYEFFENVQIRDPAGNAPIPKSPANGQSPTGVTDIIGRYTGGSLCWFTLNGKEAYVLSACTGTGPASGQCIGMPVLSPEIFARNAGTGWQYFESVQICTAEAGSPSPIVRTEDWETDGSPTDVFVHYIDPELDSGCWYTHNGVSIYIC